MGTNHPRPENMAIAARIDAAIRAKGLANTDVSAAFNDGKDPGGTRVANWRKGRNRPSAENMDMLAKLLDMTVDELLDGVPPLTVRRGRPPSPSRVGPARAAVALAMAAEHHAAHPPAARVNSVSDVFGFAMRDDGSTVIRLHAVMPPGQHERAVALIQQLLAFGLVKTEE